MDRVQQGKLTTLLKKSFVNVTMPNYLLWCNNLNLSLTKPKIDFWKRNFSYRGAAAWNGLPSE